MDKFPKTITLRDGSEITIRPMVSDDEKPLLLFFQHVPKGDLLYLMDNVTNPAVVRRWATELDYERVLPLLAFDGDHVVGNATLHRFKTGLFRHIGEIRCLISSDMRSKGLGSLLAGELFRLAMEEGLEIIQARILESQDRAARLFRTLGLKEVAVLPNYAKDAKGNRHNVLLMIADVEDLWARYSDLLHDLDVKGMY